MAYDPFRSPGGSTYPYQDNNQHNNNNHYTSSEYQYGDGGQGSSTVGMYDMDNTYPPHAHTSQPYQSYDMDPSMMDQSMDHGMGGPAVLDNVGRNKEDEFDPFAPPPKSTGDLRMWRQDHRGRLWTKFLRPPDIVFQGLAPIDSSTIQSSSNSLNVSLGLQIKVENPNFFAVALSSINAKLVYPINNTQIGGGQENNIDFRSNAATSFVFPFMLTYSEAADPDGNVLKDIASRCGFLPGSTKENINVQYTITISISILGINIHPPFSGNVDFTCPFTLQDMKPLIAAFPALQGILGPS
ncbi:hypothetical protein Clacol_006929 [Clathrus columnatus]|uniref:Late embryogenesis abundant protein LEA-2 subgroup domain-containing protein n=1 Tax=Clathrus columnatus TaxID=1419009 RepID=A0AAV5AL83_9AGAM|nr:hypothetical protein Clacol_006929 [Clathrus columnatus]